MKLVAKYRCAHVTQVNVIKSVVRNRCAHVLHLYVINEIGGQLQMWTYCNLM